MIHTVNTEAEVKAAARDWLLRLALDTPTDEERARFERWRTQDARHDAAYRRFERIWRDAASLKELEALVPLTPAGRTRAPKVWLRSIQSRPAWLAGGIALAAGLAVMAVLGSGILLRLFPPSSGHYATGIGEVRTLRLADGSTLTLGARSSIDLAFQDNERRLSLAGGEAYFDVVQDPRRPFIVAVDDKEIRVLGTAFEVRRDPFGIHVSVATGAVQLAQASMPENDKRIVNAGQQITASKAGPIQAPRPVLHQEPAAWRHGRLVYVDAPLREVVADANRYSRRPLTIADEGIENLSVSVTYPSDRVDEMLGALSRTLPVDIDRSAAHGILLKARKQGR